MARAYAAHTLDELLSAEQLDRAVRDLYGTAGALLARRRHVLLSNKDSTTLRPYQLL